MEILRTTSPSEACSYLPREVARMEYRLIFGQGERAFEAMLNRGWRRFGYQYFRPACAACQRCRSLRVEVERFRPSRSQRRALKRNADVEVRIGPAGVSEEHVRLYNAYHADMEERRAWAPNRITADEYAESFIGCSERFGYEFQYLRKGQLIGVGLVDVLPNCLSSAYFFHDPGWRAKAPGTFSLLQEIDFARRTGRPWLHLGYWIAENASMKYKARFRPHQLLRRHCGDDEEPVWEEPEVES